MKKEIPHIIHQVWSGLYGPPQDYFLEISKTWKEHHPDWMYEFWDNYRMDDFVKKYYSQYWDIYKNYKYNIQRWDAIRYLILYKMGGMYVDFDYECLEPFDAYLQGKYCCFASEHKEHHPYGRPVYFNNALMASIPGHPFMNKIIQRTFDENFLNREFEYKSLEVLETTGPLMLVDLYLEENNKEGIFLIPAEIVTPFSKQDAMNAIHGKKLDILEHKIQNAMAVHYCMGGWL